MASKVYDMIKKALSIAFLSLSAMVTAAGQADTASVPVSGGVIRMQGAFLRPLQKRDSVLIADQFLYGVHLEGVEENTGFSLPDLSKGLTEKVEALSPWQVDTVKTRKSRRSEARSYDMEIKTIITTFEEGRCELPGIVIQRHLPDGRVDTLLFEPQSIEVKTMPVDTTSYVPHDIKGQIRYPVTFEEIKPYLIGFYGTAALLIALFCLLNMRKRGEKATVTREAPHIIALRKLDGFRGSKYWAGDKQKIFYSGVTDALREYMSARYGIGAMEMTTAEIFRELDGKEIPSGLYNEMKALFECSDFVKFAKLTVSDEDNAKVLPSAVKFVTSTYQEEIDREAEENNKENDVL